MLGLDPERTPLGKYRTRGEKEKDSCEKSAYHCAHCAQMPRSMVVANDQANIFQILLLFAGYAAAATACTAAYATAAAVCAADS